MQNLLARKVLHDLLGVKMLTHTIVYADISLLFTTS